MLLLKEPRGSYHYFQDTTFDIISRLMREDRLSFYSTLFDLWMLFEVFHKKLPWTNIEVFYIGETNSIKGQ